MKFVVQLVCEVCGKKGQEMDITAPESRLFSEIINANFSNEEIFHYKKARLGQKRYFFCSQKCENTYFQHNNY